MTSEGNSSHSRLFLSCEHGKGKFMLAKKIWGVSGTLKDRMVICCFCFGLNTVPYMYLASMTKRKGPNIILFFNDSNNDDDDVMTIVMMTAIIRITV